jgi:hypothetical protein
MGSFSGSTAECWSEGLFTEDGTFALSFDGGRQGAGLSFCGCCLPPPEPLAEPAPVGGITPACSGRLLSASAGGGAAL